MIDKIDETVMRSIHIKTDHTDMAKTYTYENSYSAHVHEVFNELV